MGPSITFSSSPPRLSQLLLAWDQVFNPQINSKQTFLKINAHSEELSVPGQDSGISGNNINPTRIHKNTDFRISRSIVIMFRAQEHSAAETVAERANEQGDFCLSHGNLSAFSRKKLCICLGKLLHHPNKMQSEGVT